MLHAPSPRIRRRLLPTFPITACGNSSGYALVLSGHTGLFRRAFSSKKDDGKDMNIDALVEYFMKHVLTHEKKPPQKFDVELGDSIIKTRRFLADIRADHTKLSAEQRARLFEVAPHALDAKTVTKDQKIDRLVAFYHQHGRWSKQREADEETGLAVGQLLNGIKQGATSLTKEQRTRLLGVDPHALDVKHISNAAKTMTMDQKIDRLIAFYQRHERWPKRSEADKDTGLAVGRILSSIKQGGFNLVKDQHDRLLAVDPHSLDVKHISHAARTMTKDQKINRLIAFYQEHGRWPKQPETDKDTGLRLGQLLSDIKQGATSLTKEQRDRLLAVDPHALDVKSTSVAAKNKVNDDKIDRLIAFYQRYGRWPKQRELDDDTGLALGRWLSAVKWGKPPLNKKQRTRLLAVDPHVLNVKPRSPISQAAKTMTMDQKFNRLLGFYHQHKRWPKRREIDAATGLPLGTLLSRIKQAGTSLTREQRGRLLAMDPDIRIVKPKKDAARIVKKDQKIHLMGPLKRDRVTGRVGRLPKSIVKDQGLFWKSNREVTWKAVVYAYLFLGAVLWTVMEAIALII